MLWFLIIPWMVVAIAIAIVPIVVMLSVECQELRVKARVAPGNPIPNSTDAVPNSTGDRERIPVGSGV